MALLLIGQVVAGQVEIKGTVYDRSQSYALPRVSVLGTSGIGTMTDSLGHYRIKLVSGDSLYFSYLGKFTTKFPVKDIPPGYPFDMSLEVGIDTLPFVYVRPKDYRLDSLENREEYRKVFDYSPNYLNNMKMDRRGGMGIGFNLRMYRPSYELIQSCETEYEFYKYIFNWGKAFSEAWKEEHPE